MRDPGNEIGENPSMGFLFFPMMSMGLRLAALRVAGAPLPSYELRMGITS